MTILKDTKKQGVFFTLSLEDTLFFEKPRQIEPPNCFSLK